MRSSDGKTRSVVKDIPGAGWDYSITRHPYHEHERPKGAHYCVYNRRLMAVCFDDHTIEEGYWRLRELFGSGAIAIPNDSELMGELAALRYHYDKMQRLSLESKDNMRRRGLSSPDKADALMLAFVERPPRPRIWT